MRYLITLLLIFALAAGATAESLRIGLIRQFKNVPQVTVSSENGLTVSAESGSVILANRTTNKVILSAKDGQLQINCADTIKPVGDKIEISSSSCDAVITLSTSSSSRVQYRGKIEADVSDRGIFLVNIIDLEDYIRGVLPSEMPSSFEIEALKAQAVAARTYAWMNRGKHKKSGYDLCDSTDCQVYLGAEKEKAATSKAVAETKGLVIVHEGRLIWAQYSSDCGGTTQDGGKPYLSPVPDCPEGGGADYCEHNGHSWTKSWLLQDFERILSRTYPELKGVMAISISQMNSANRVDEVEVKAESGNLSIEGAKLRNLLGNTTIRSTFFTVKMEDGKVIFDGRGFGHGRGLCQFGANGLAKSPYNYTFEQILKHYYQGVDIVQISQVQNS